MYRREGIAGVYELKPDRRGLAYLGNLEFPAEARVLEAGDSLLVEVSDSTDEFEVLPLKQEVAALHQAAEKGSDR